jgi:hypothetical protein
MPMAYLEVAEALAKGKRDRVGLFQLYLFGDDDGVQRSIYGKGSRNNTVIAARDGKRGRCDFCHPPSCPSWSHSHPIPAPYTHPLARPGVSGYDGGEGGGDAGGVERDAEAAFVMFEHASGMVREYAYAYLHIL